MEGGGHAGLDPLAAVHEVARPVHERLAALGSGELAEDRRGHVLAHLQRRAVVVPVGVRRLVEEGVERIEFRVRNGVVLVGVALGAAPGESHPRLPGRGDPVLDGGVAKLLVVGAALRVGHRVAVKPRRDQVVGGRIRQQIPGELADRELVEGHVVVQRIDDPVAIGPDRPQAVLLVAHRVRVARQVQPHAGPPLAVRRGIQETVHKVRVGFWGRVGSKRVSLLRGRRQACQVQRKPADQCVAVSLAGGAQAFAVQPRQDEAVDGVAGPARVRDLRRAGSDRRVERPVALVRRSRINPGGQRLNLAFRQALPGRRHRTGIRGDARHHPAGCAVTGDDPRVSALPAGCSLPEVEAQVGHAAVSVRAVARKALLEDRAHFGCEVRAGSRRHGDRGEKAGHGGGPGSSGDGSQGHSVASAVPPLPGSGFVGFRPHGSRSTAGHVVPRGRRADAAT